jgi:hypothetical protein
MFQNYTQMLNFQEGKRFIDNDFTDALQLKLTNGRRCRKTQSWSIAADINVDDKNKDAVPKDVSNRSFAGVLYFNTGRRHIVPQVPLSVPCFEFDEWTQATNILIHYWKPWTRQHRIQITLLNESHTTRTTSENIQLTNNVASAQIKHTKLVAQESDGVLTLQRFNV